MNQYDNLPQELRATGKFNCWRYETKKGGGKPAKIPYNVYTGGRGQSNNPATFTDYPTALSYANMYDGLGMGVFGDLVFIDIDNCVKDGVIITAEARDIVEAMNCYTEISPSGTGLRIIGKVPGFNFDASRYYIHNRRLGLEIYIAGATKKYLTVTGNTIRAKELEECGAQLQTVLEKYMIRPSPRKPDKSDNIESQSYLSDDAVLTKAMSAKNGEAFRRLWEGDTSGYESPSEADMALCCMLSFWCGRETEQMDRLFRRSGLYRDKWDGPRSGSTYGALTLEKAAAAAQETYTPGGKRYTSADDFSDGITLEAIEGVHYLDPLCDEKKYTLDDTGNGSLFADTFIDQARYVKQAAEWYIYDGVHWKIDEGSLMVSEMAKSLVRHMGIIAAKIEDEDKRSRHLKHAAKLSANKIRDAMLVSARSIYPLDLSEFDRNPNLFNCLNGTLDLESFEFKLHDPKDFLSKVANVIYDPKARCPRFDSFISEIMDGDEEKIRYLQKAIGYSMTGNTAEKKCFFLYGRSTNNGKSTLTSALLHIYGDYGTSIQSNTLERKQFGTGGSAPSPDIAMLAGKRFVSAAEPDRSMRLDAGLLKQLTGGADPIMARFMRQNFFKFYPAFKLFLHCNDLPSTTDDTLFSSDRVQIIEFNRHFKGREQDKGLESEFKKPENASGIFNWMIEGCRLYQSTGLCAPISVQAATAAYRSESDLVGSFCSDCLERKDGSSILASAVYESYQYWCKQYGYKEMSFKNFNRDMKRHVESAHSNSGKVFKGVVIKAIRPDGLSSYHRCG